MSNLKNNQRILGRLIGIFNQLITAELLLSGPDQRKISTEADRIQQTINDLRGKILDDWIGKAPNIKSQLAAATQKVEDAVEDIEDDIDTAKKVVKIIGVVDDVLGVVRPLL